MNMAISGASAGAHHFASGVAAMLSPLRQQSFQSCDGDVRSGRHFRAGDVLADRLVFVVSLVILPFLLFY